MLEKKGKWKKEILEKEIQMGKEGKKREEIAAAESELKKR